jgi:hypothetical protein
MSLLKHCQRFANETRKRNENRRDQSSSDSSGFDGLFSSPRLAHNGLFGGSTVSIQLIRNGRARVVICAAGRRQRLRETAPAVSGLIDRRCQRESTTLIAQSPLLALDKSMLSHCTSMAD